MYEKAGVYLLRLFCAVIQQQLLTLITNQMHNFLKALILCLVFSYELAGQNVKIQWGKPLESSVKITSFMASKEGRLYTLSAKGDDYYIECFEQGTYNKLFSTKLDIPRIVNKKQEIEEIIFQGSQFIIFTSYYNKPEKKFRLNAYSINMQGVLNPKPTELIKLEAEGKNDIGDIFFRFSPDSANILITHIYTSPKTKLNHLEFFILDKSLTILSQADNIIKSKTDDAYNILMNCYINNNKEIFLTELQLVTPTETRDSKFSYSIIKYASDGKETDRFPVELEDKRIISFSVQFNDNGDLMVYGHYKSNPGKKERYYDMSYNGTYFILLNAQTGAVKSVSQYNFETELFNNYYQLKQTKNGPITYFGVNSKPGKVIQKENGGYVITYEEFYMQFNQGPNGASSQTYYYGDLLIVNIDPKGDILWVKMVPKRQYFIRKQGPLGIGIGPVMLTTSVNLNSDESIYYSYNVVIKDEQIFVLYNDLPANAPVTKPRDIKILKKIKGTVPVVAILNENGEMRKKTLTEIAGTEVNLCPRISLPLDQNHLLIYGSKGKDYKLGELTVE
ncbi:MAG: hypothetical protein IM638_03740 [Bacteroidetes bacterium]|nr:hypothetical protein [Bacteroidota bacterium]